MLYDATLIGSQRLFRPWRWSLGALREVSLAVYQFTWCHIPEDVKLCKCQCENLKCHRNILALAGIDAWLSGPQNQFTGQWAILTSHLSWYVSDFWLHMCWHLWEPTVTVSSHKCWLVTDLIASYSVTVDTDFVCDSWLLYVLFPLP